MHAALNVKAGDRLPNVSACQLLDGFLQLGIALAQNLIQPDSFHPRFPKLCKWSASFNGLVLPRVAHQQHAIAPMKALKEFIHLASRCERRFVEHIQPLLTRVRLFASCKRTLQS